MVALRAEDLALARRCVDGDREAQRTLFRRQRARVHATLYRVLGSNTHIEDLVQDAFLEIFRSLATFRGEASLSTWIDRCTVRVAFAFLDRKRKTAQLAIVADPAVDASGVDRRVAAREALRHLYRALDQLPAPQRVAFVLHEIEGRARWPRSPT